VLEEVAAVCGAAGDEDIVEASGAEGVSAFVGVEVDGVSGAWVVDFVALSPHASKEIKRIGRIFFMID